MKYIVLLRSATGAIRFLTGPRSFSGEFPDAQTFDTIGAAKKAGKGSKLFGLEVHNRDQYGTEENSWVANT